MPLSAYSRIYVYYTHWVTPRVFSWGMQQQLSPWVQFQLRPRQPTAVERLTAGRGPLAAAAVAEVPADDAGGAS